MGDRVNPRPQILAESAKFEVDWADTGPVNGPINKAVNSRLKPQILRAGIDSSPGGDRRVLLF